MGRVTACSAASLQANSWAYATVRATKARDLSARRKTPRNTAAFSRGFIRLGGVSGDVRALGHELAMGRSRATKHTVAAPLSAHRELPPHSVGWFASSTGTTITIGTAPSAM